MALGRDFAILYETDPERGPVVALGRVEWSGETAVLWQGGAPMILPPPHAMSRCEALPPQAYAGLGEALALFQAFDTISEACEGATGRSCAQSAFDFADVSGDARLSLAEISRLTRAIATFASYETMITSRSEDASSSVKVPVSALSGTAMFFSIAVPMVTRNLLASYDFDGDGFLTLDEISQDRGPLLEISVGEAASASIGAAAAQGLMSQMVGFLMSNSSQMLMPFLAGFMR